MKDPFDNVKPQLIDIDSLVVLTEVQPRTQLHKATVDQYIEDMGRGEKFPPLCVFKDPDTRERILASGFHTTEAHRGAGTRRVHAKIVPGDRNDARMYAAGTNADHGKPRTIGDKRRVVDRVLRMKPNLGDREIARRCRVTHPFVSKRRVSMVETQSGNVTTGGDEISGGEVRFDVGYECGELRNMVTGIAGRCTVKDMQTLIVTLHELGSGMTKRRKRMAEDAIQERT